MSRVSSVHLMTLEFIPPCSYDDNQFLSEVDADFVIWELHGRTDFGYTATAEEVSTMHILIACACIAEQYC